MKLAPIALFVYNRPDHTSRVLEAIRKNDLARDSDLYVFADGPKKNSTPQALEQVKSVRNLVTSISGFKSVHVSASDENKGLSSSITSGINTIFESHDSIIVFEDDIVPHASFLTFCNQALVTYKDHEKVYAVSGYSYPLKAALPATYFLKTGAVWGWGCWKRSWQHFTPDSGKLLREIESGGRVAEFNFDNSYNYFEMLKQHHEGKISSWDVCWYASIFVADGLTYYPGKSLTTNIGMDGSGTHYTGTKDSAPVEADLGYAVDSVAGILNHRPERVEEDLDAAKALSTYLSRLEKGGMMARIRQAIKKYGKINS